MHAVMPGCDAWSFVPDRRRPGPTVGALVLHGFTGTPMSVRNVAEAIAAEGYDVELPRLPGHGTTIDEMQTTSWSDWAGEAEAAYQRLADRVDRVVVIGLSMGGTLTLNVALAHPEVAAIACINPAAQARDAETLGLISSFLADGVTVVPGEGRSDVADPDAADTAYADTPLEPLRSLLVDGIAPIADRYGELTMPLRLFTSRDDHVVTPDDSVHLAANYGGPVEHTWLERSYHVATQDYDRDLIIAEVTALVARVASSSAAR